MWACVLIGMASLTAPFPAQAQTLVSLRPLPGAAWQVAAEENGCAMRRAFGSAEQPVTLVLYSAGGLGQFDMAISGPGARDLAGAASATLRIDGRNAPSPTNAVRLPNSRALPGGAVRFKGDHPARLTLRSAAAVVEVVTPERVLSFTNASFGGALTAINNCIDDIWRGDGVDPALARRATTLAVPRGSENGWVTPDDYPSAALRVEAEGRTVARLVIDTEGRVSGCRVASSSGNEALDTRTCELMRQRARFLPARDASGVAVPSVVVRATVWLLPEPIR